MKETRYNLQYDWEGILGDVEDIMGTAKKREIMDSVIYEIDCFRNQSWLRRLFNLMPIHWIDIWLQKEPAHYFWKPIWHNVKSKTK